LAKRDLCFDSLESRQLLSGLTPAQLRRFYGLNHVFNQNPSTKGAGVSIAVVVPYDNPSAARDVARYFDGPYHLAGLSLTTFNLGVAGNQPSLAWSTEAESDIEMIHSIAPLADIDLVEATDDTLQSLMEADRYAASLPGVVVVSDSWGIPEFTAENQLDQYVSAVGVTFVAATGDDGVPDYPAVSPNVIAVGGTWVSGNSAAIWNNSGAGMSQVYAGRRVPDVGMAVNSTVLTGTSVSAALFAGLVGIADALRLHQGLSALSTADVRSRMESVIGTNQYHNDFNEVTHGRGSHRETDPAAGLGSPKAPGLIALLSS
jgi:subtilase family serine protease